MCVFVCKCGVGAGLDARDKGATDIDDMPQVHVWAYVSVCVCLHANVYRKWRWCIYMTKSVSLRNICMLLH